MKSQVEQYIWNLLEDLGLDAENDKEVFNQCDKCVLNIVNIYDRYINQINQSHEKVNHSKRRKNQS